MIEIKHNIFYTVADLTEMFASQGMDWKTIRMRLIINKVVGNGFWGQHIIDAINEQGTTDALPHRGKIKERH